MNSFDKIDLQNYKDFFEGKLINFSDIRLSEMPQLLSNIIGEIGIPKNIIHFYNSCFEINESNNTIKIAQSEFVSDMYIFIDTQKKYELFLESSGNVMKFSSDIEKCILSTHLYWLFQDLYRDIVEEIDIKNPILDKYENLILLTNLKLFEIDKVAMSEGCFWSYWLRGINEDFELDKKFRFSRNRSTL